MKDCFYFFILFFYFSSTICAEQKLQQSFSLAPNPPQHQTTTLSFFTKEDQRYLETIKKFGLAYLNNNEKYNDAKIVIIRQLTKANPSVSKLIKSVQTLIALTEVAIKNPNFSPLRARQAPFHKALQKHLQKLIRLEEALLNQ